MDANSIFRRERIAIVPNLHIGVLVNAADLIAAACDDLPSLQRSLVHEHFIDSQSVFVLARRHGMRRREIVAVLESALKRLRVALGRRNVRSVADLI